MLSNIYRCQQRQYHWSEVEDLVGCAGLQRMHPDENDGLEDNGVWSIYP